MSKQKSVKKAAKIKASPKNKTEKPKAKVPLRATEKARPVAAVVKARAPEAPVKAEPISAVDVKPKKASKGAATKVSMKGVSERKLAKAAEASEKASQLSQKWSSLYKKSQDVQAKPYNMRAVFEAKTPIMHKVLGWGYILNNKNDRLEVLFQDGIRYLISNYKS